MTDALFPAPSVPVEMNPCVQLYGSHEGTCATCAHLVRSPRESGRYWLKCDLRTHTHGAATDHRAGWNACGRWERRDDD